MIILIIYQDNRSLLTLLILTSLIIYINYHSNTSEVPYFSVLIYVINSIFFPFFCLYFSSFLLVISFSPPTFVTRYGIRDSSGIADSAIRTFLFRFQGPFFSGSAHRLRGLPGAVRRPGPILLPRALSYGPKLSSFSSRGRHHRASSTSTAFCLAPEDHGGVVKAAYGVILSKRSSTPFV